MFGFEFKSSRADLLRELKNPEKSVPVQSYCHKWFLVLGRKDLAEDDEIPPNWGVLVPHGENLRVRRKAAVLEAKPITYTFFASLCRALNKHSEFKKIEKDAFAKGHASGMKQAEENRKYTKTIQEREFESLKKMIKDFEEASGIKMSPWCAGRVGDAVNLLFEHNVDARCVLERTLAALETPAKRVREALESLDTE